MPRPLSRYSTVAIILHWLIAALLLSNLWLGLAMGGQRGAPKLDALQLHQSVGVTILLLSLLRLGWRLANPPPPEAPGVAHWEKTSSALVHFGFYLIMIGMPLSGWLIESARPALTPILLYHWGGFRGLPWPHLPIAAGLTASRRKALGGAAADIHLYMSYGAYGLIALHLLGALKHQLFNRNPVLPRMLPFLKRRAHSA
jgi:cytochrome b561